jgi:hypothetical protein
MKRNDAAKGYRFEISIIETKPILQHVIIYGDIASIRRRL